ncbi:MAG: hypothetical protein HOP08_05715 [Cyclobacteriaceae bacterium]|nr:hypothetical protein [Cyclobacteriaceae bacterium]
MKLFSAPSSSISVRLYFIAFVCLNLTTPGSAQVIHLKGIKPEDISY